MSTVRLLIKFSDRQMVSPGSAGNSPSEFLFGDAPGRSYCRKHKRVSEPEQRRSSVCVRVCEQYHGSRGGLDDPGVLRSDEAETVESSQVTVHLLL